MKILAAIISLFAVLQQPSIQVEVRLQQYVVSVRNSSDVLVRHLRMEDFRIEEDGVPQPIAFFTEGTEEHVSLGILIDVSGSMLARSGGLSRLSAAEGTASVLMRMMKPRDEFMLMSFDDALNVNRKFTEDPEGIETSLRKLKTGGGTNLWGAVDSALKKMKDAKNRKRALVIITDGLAGGDLAALAREIRNSEVTIYTFGLGSSQPNASAPFPVPFSPPGFRAIVMHTPQEIMQTIAEESGGRSEFFDVGDLDDAIHKMVEFDRVIAADLRGQYTLAYYPKNPAAAIRVRANDASFKLSVRRAAMARPPAEK